jgi:hypothetical protein
MKAQRPLFHALWAVPLALAVAAWPQFAAAWFENTVAAKTASPSGCFSQFNSFDHHGAETSVRASVTPMGFAAISASQCSALNIPGVVSRIKGLLTVTVIKLIKAGATGQPDSVSICSVASASATSWASSISLNKALSHPPNQGPCGNGFYAQISCLQNATIRITDGVVAIDGAFNATDPKTHCVISPVWHGVNLKDANGQPILMGGFVKL